MNANDEVDRIVLGWLAEGPEELPDRVLDAAVDEIHLTRQRHALRVPWRFPPMSTPVRLASAAIVVVIGVAVGASVLGRPASNIGGPATPFPSPTSTPLSTLIPPVVPSSVLVKFSSAAYEYSIDYPSNWKIRRSDRQILLHEYPYDQAGADFFSATAPDVNDPELVVAAPVVDGGMTLDAWVALIEKLQTDDSCPSPGASEDIQLGGEPGRLLTWNCPYFLFWAAVVHGNRAYHVIWNDQLALGSPALQAADKALFERLLASFTYTTNPPAAPSPS
jgi:hypothetical protein